MERDLQLLTRSRQVCFGQERGVNEGLRASVQGRDGLYESIQQLSTPITLQPNETDFFRFVV